MSRDLAVLNREAIAAAKQHMGHIAWPTVLLTLVIIAAYTGLLVLFASGTISWWLAAPLVILLHYLSYTPLHEAVHGNISGNNDDKKWLNDLCGYLIAPFVGLPYGTHRLEHFNHHRYTNQPGKDPDYVISDFGKGFVSSVRTILNFSWTQQSYFAQHYWIKATTKEKVVNALEVTIGFGWRVLFTVLVAEPGAFIVAFIAPIIGVLLLMYLFAYLPHLPYTSTERYRNTNSLVMPTWMKPVEWFMLGQSLHSIHHLFPRVPFYRYRALYDEIQPIMQAHGAPELRILMDDNKVEVVTSKV